MPDPLRDPTPPRVGIRIVPAHPGDAAGIARMVDRAVEAEAAGLGLVAIPERLGAGGVPAALPVCAAIAARTTRIAIATALLPLPFHHPLRAAEDGATVDALSDGRFELGIGLGADRAALAGFGLEAADRGDRFEEAVALLRAAWSDGPISHRGVHFAVEGIEVFPKPARPGGPPLWVGARAPGALVRAGRLRLGVLVEPGTDLAPYVEAWRDDVHPDVPAQAPAHGPDGPRVAMTGAADEIVPPARASSTRGGPVSDVWIDIDPADATAIDRAAAVAGNWTP